VARATQHYEILRSLVTISLVAVVMNVKRRVAATARLALVSGSRKRLHPPHLPLWLLPVLGSHLVQLGSPCLLSEASCAALLIVLVQPMRVSGPFKFWTGATPRLPKTPPIRSSHNSLRAKFAELVFCVAGCIKRLREHED
jgi:hypothetical protein